MRQRVGRVFNTKADYFLGIFLVTIFVVTLLGFRPITVFAADCKLNSQYQYDEVLDTWNWVFTFGQGWNEPGFCTVQLQYWDNTPGLRSCTYQVINKVGADWPLDPFGWLVPPGQPNEFWCDPLQFATTNLDVFIDPAGDCYVGGEEGCMIAARAEDDSIPAQVGIGSLTLDIGQPPEPPSNLTASVTECGETLKGNYLVKFSWDYVHLALIDMDGFQIRMNKNNSFTIDVDENPSYTAPEYECDPIWICGQNVSWPSGTNVDYEPASGRWENWLDGSGDFTLQSEKWDETIYWGVRTRDVNDLWSSWSSSTVFPGAFVETPDHPYPWIDFDLPLDGVSVGEEALFEDRSRCFDAPILGDPPAEGDCIPPGDSHFWDFPGDNLSEYNCTDTQPVWCEIGEPDPIIIYSAMLPPGIVRLEVTDDVGMCPKEESLTLEFPLPKYREVAPIL